MGNITNASMGFVLGMIVNLAFFRFFPSLGILGAAAGVLPGLGLFFLLSRPKRTEQAMTSAKTISETMPEKIVLGPTATGGGALELPQATKTPPPQPTIGEATVELVPKKAMVKVMFKRTQTVEGYIPIEKENIVDEKVEIIAVENPTLTTHKPETEQPIEAK